MNIQKIGNRNIVITWKVPDGWNVNIHLILGEKSVYIIDTGLGSKHIKDVMEYLKDNKKQIIIINTHHHWDHIWGNYMFKENQIISHSLCKELIRLNWQEMIETKGKYVMGQTELCLPTTTFEEELYFQEDHIRLLYSPGHTKDSISVLDEEDKVINIGDNIGDDMEDLVPSIKTDLEVYINTLKKYISLNAIHFVSGHNRVTDKNVVNELLNLVLSI